MIQRSFALAAILAASAAGSSLADMHEPEPAYDPMAEMLSSWEDLRLLDEQASAADDMPVDVLTESASDRGATAMAAARSSDDSIDYLFRSPDPRGRSNGTLRVHPDQIRTLPSAAATVGALRGLRTSLPEASEETAEERIILPHLLPTIVDYKTEHEPGTVVINTPERYLYLVLEDGKARRYGIGVGKPGFEWAGEHRVSKKVEWPTWTPPAEMIDRDPKLADFVNGMPGGLWNPLGARALYLGSTLYRIHGSNEPWTIGQAVSSGCIRMRNEDVVDLYERLPLGTKVIVI